ncbi:chaperonin 10-like protein [Plectosphaerella plurivora]|uniref:Chaperonin 10-like protein n=1 Tax=Plectosphaerella plurivora TaxID=936078 RepID=A0A9P8VA06_9PEZI|nr:chaperonin 10-like protein [Plectosphaerella plurivora]
MADQTTHLAAMLPSVGGNLVISKRDTPTPAAGEILIRNRAIAVNPIDWKRQAYGFMTPSFPLVLGADIAGEVVAIGPSVEGFKAGDHVVALAHGLITGNANNGAFQEFTSAQAKTTSKVPETLSLTQAVTLPTAVGTAVMILVESLGLPQSALETANASASSAPQSILIWGGASAVGNLLIQIAHKVGLFIYATASAKHHDKLRELGADVLFDYASGTVAEDILKASEEAGKPIEWAVGCITKDETLAPVTAVLKGSTAKGAKKLVITSPLPASATPAEGIETTQVRGDELWHRRSDLGEWLCWEALPAWLASGEIKPLEARVVDGGLEGLQNAMDQLKQGVVSGEKLVVEV